MHKAITKQSARTRRLDEAERDLRSKAPRKAGGK